MAIYLLNPFPESVDSSSPLPHPPPRPLKRPPVRLLDHVHRLEDDRFPRDDALPQPRQPQNRTDRLGILVLLGRRKNNSLRRSDFEEEKKHLQTYVETFAKPVRAMQAQAWDLPPLQAHHLVVLEKLRVHCHRRTPASVSAPTRLRISPVGHQAKLSAA